MAALRELIAAPFLRLRRGLLFDAAMLAVNVVLVEPLT